MHRSARTAFLATVLCATGIPVMGGEKHSLLGTWSVDVGKLQQPNPPKSVTITLAEADAGAYHMTVVIQTPDGAKINAESTFKPDGSPARAVGSMDVDIVSMTMPSKRIVVMGAGMDGHPSSSRVFSLSDDGKHMIETIIRHQDDGTPYTKVNTWTRVTGKKGRI